MGNLSNRVPGTLKALSKAQFESNRQQVRNNLACSGMVEYGKHQISNYVMGEGMFAFTTQPSSIFMGRHDVQGNTGGTSTTNYPILNVDGIMVHIRGGADTTTHVNHDTIKYDITKIDLPEAPTAQVETSTTTTRDYAQGDHVVVGNDIYICVAELGSSTGDSLLNDTLFELRDLVSDEILIGVEVFAVELGVSIDVVYPYGNVQCLEKTWNGFTLDNTLNTPQYSELGDWNVDPIVGLGYRWSALSASERNIWLGDVANNIYEEDGKYYQWQYRLKVTKGLGQAWSSTRPTSRYNSAVRASSTGEVYSQSLLRLRGKRDDAYKDLGTDNGAIAFTYGHSSRSIDVDFGTSVSRKNNGAVTGIVTDSEMMYYYPIATVTRYNQGGYHPILNPMGTNTFRRQDIDADNPWYFNEIYKPQTVADCFNFTYEAMTPGVFPHAGTYTSGRSGHPLGYKHDLIYDHLVNDLRLSAHGVSTSADDIAFNMTFGITPGWEAVTKTLYHKTTVTAYPNVHRVEVATLPSDDYIGGGWMYNVTRGVFSPCMRFSPTSYWFQTLHSSVNPLAIQPGVSTATVLAINDRPDVWEVGDEVIIIMYENTSIYMRKHTQTDVIATPDKLHDMLLGYGFDVGFNLNWIPALPDGTLKEFKANRRVAATAANSLTTNDAGVNWIADTSFISNYLMATNSNSKEIYSNQVQFIQYEFNSRIVGHDEEKLNFATTPITLPFQNAALSRVWATTSSDDALGGNLIQSTIGEVAVGNSATPVSYAMERHGLKNRYDSYLFDQTVLQRVAHADIDNLDASNGIKYFVTLGYHLGSGMVYAQVNFKKLFYQPDNIPVQVIDLSTQPTVTLKKGDRFKLINTRNSNIEGTVLSSLTDSTFTWGTATFDKHRVNYDDGRIYRGNGTIMGIAELAPFGSYGEYGEFITPSSSNRIDYYQDLNGNLGVTGVFRSINPIGFLPKKSRR